MRHSTLLLLSFFIRSLDALSVPTARQCKSIAALTGWPDPSVWKKFNTSLSGALLEPLPPAQACYSLVSNSSASSTRCDYTESSWLLSSFHSADPVSVAYPNWQDNACVPPSLSEESAGRCDLTDFPKYVVNASTAEHVARAVKFAAANNVRIVVKGGAHDLLGRCVVVVVVAAATAAAAAAAMCPFWTFTTDLVQVNGTFSAFLVDPSLAGPSLPRQVLGMSVGTNTVYSHHRCSWPRHRRNTADGG